MHLLNNWDLKLTTPEGVLDYHILYKRRSTRLKWNKIMYCLSHGFLILFLGPVVQKGVLGLNAL